MNSISTTTTTTTANPDAGLGWINNFLARMVLGQEADTTYKSQAEQACSAWEFLQQSINLIPWYSQAVIGLDDNPEEGYWAPIGTVEFQLRDTCHLWVVALRDPSNPGEEVYFDNPLFAK